MTIQLSRTFTFCAAHRVPVSPNKAARRLHGHTFGVELILEGGIEGTSGWLVDFGEVARAFAPCGDRLDHCCLNEIEGLENPDAATLQRWLFDRLKSGLPVLKSVRVTILGQLRFLPDTLRADDRIALPERLACSLESAHRLPFLEKGHKCSGIHGHSYRVEVGAGDLHRLVEPLRSVYNQLDHQYLNDIGGLENPTSETMAVWIWQRLEPHVPGLTLVIVRESPHCMCIYRGEGD